MIQHNWKCICNLMKWPGLLVLLMMMACNPALKYTMQGDKLAADGNYEEATSYYYTALLKKKNYIPAQTGLGKSAQKVLNDKFEVFRGEVLQNQLEQAIKQYQGTQQFYANAEKVGVKLEWQAEFDEIYTDVKHEYAVKLFDQVISLINQKKFDVAEKKLGELALLDTNYRPVSVLRMNTVLQPLYNEGSKQFNEGKFQQAYTTFNRLYEIDDQFLDVKEMRDQSLSRATTRYAVLPVVCSDKTLSDPLNEYLDQHINGNKASFVNIVSYKSVGELLESRGWSGFKNTEQAVQAGKTLGFQFLIYTELKVITDTVMLPMIEKKTAYEAFTENILNPYTDTYSYITKFKKADYTDVSESQQLKYGVTVYLLDCSTGLALYKDYFEENKKDELHKLEYKGNINNLYEDLPQGNYLPPVDREWREQFTGAKRNLTDKQLLKKQLLSDIAVQVSFKMKKHIK